VARYAWNFGDAQTTTKTTPSASHTYAAAGRYTATLEVTDNDGCSAKRIFTGQTVSCNGTPAALAAHTVLVARH
jgi:PKD repeat protein